MSPARIRLALLSIALALRVLGDVLLCRMIIPNVVNAELSNAIGLLSVVLAAPLLVWLTNRYSRRMFLAAALSGPLGLVLFVTGAPLVAVVAVIVGGGCFQAVGLALLPDAAREARVAFPRVVAGLLLLDVLALTGATVFPPNIWSHGIALLVVYLVSIVAASVASVGSVTQGRTEAGPGGGRLRAGGFLAGTALFSALLVCGSAVHREHCPWTVGGVALGCVLAGWQRNPARSPGLIPLAGGALFLALGWSWIFGPGEVGAALVGAAGGFGLVPLVAAYLAGLSAQTRGPGAAWLFVALVLTSLMLVVPIDPGVLALVAAGFACASTYLLFGPLVEQLLEVAFAPLWRVRVHGPGAQEIPLDGPVVIVCNHTSYIDPLWVGKVVPRKVIAMMTSVFYDMPVVRWLMVHVTRAIRVPAATFRREAPELQDAIRVLQGGGCLLIFPEARLRKTEEKLLYPFGQGLWHILKAVPETRVVTVWIEGGWGSWTSYGNNAPPFKGKAFDWMRQIALAFSQAEPVCPELLAEREAFRVWLMERVLGCRLYLNLPVPTIDQALGRETVPENSDPLQNNSESEGNC